MDIEIREIIVQQYCSGKPMYLLKKIFHISSTTIKNILKQHHVVFMASQRRKYKIDIEYFDNIDTEEKAYFLGLLYARLYK